MEKADSLRNILSHFQNALNSEREELDTLQRRIKEKEMNISGFTEAIYLIKVDLHKLTGEGECSTCFWSFAGGCSRLNPNAVACLIKGVHTKYEPRKEKA